MPCRSQGRRPGRKHGGDAPDENVAEVLLPDATAALADGSRTYSTPGRYSSLPALRCRTEYTSSRERRDALDGRTGIRVCGLL